MDNSYDYKTLERIQPGLQSSLFRDDHIRLRAEQRDAIDKAKAQFCKRTGNRKDGYTWTINPTYSQFLWNAKMRFGKTLCALQLAREMGVKRTLIVTHRPVVNKGWEDDFRNVVNDKIEGNDDVRDHWAYGTLVDDEQHDKRKFYDLEKFVSQSDDNHYVFFVSMQYLRLSELVNTKTQLKNKDKQADTYGHSAARENEKLKADILHNDWDLVVIDEAHEGTRTALGKRVIDEFLKKDDTKMLHLSGTPFNLYEDFKENEIFTWDYISEQRAKQEWPDKHPGEDNPYAELPQMNIFTYDIRNNIQNVLDDEGIFTFSEFFRTWTGNPKADHAVMPEGAKGRFVHEAEVNKFLDLLCDDSDETNFPFSTDEYREMFRHTLWVVSHVDEAAALKQLLSEHPKFGSDMFRIINVAGQGDMDEENENALDAVNNAIGDMPEETYTITISCGRLTTGVTVRPWTAVFYLKGGDRAATYMQTIFRVQSPYVVKDCNGNVEKMKTSCYVFDFAPDRTLKVVAETAKFSSMAKANEEKGKAKKKDGDDDTEDELTQEQRDKITVKDFIKLCPVISMDGGKMTSLDVNSIYKQLESVYIDRLVQKGFDDPCLYNQEEVNKVNPEILNHIGENGGQAPDERRKEAKTVIDLNNMTPEQRAQWEENIRRKKAEAAEKAEKKAAKDEAFRKQWEAMSEAEREEYLQKEAEKAARREELKKQREEFKARMTNIRGIALRIPLLMYGGADAGDPKDDLTVDNFTRKIKDESWAEFMPKGISKEDFNKIRKCFNATRFEEAGKRYRALTREADFMHVEERIKQITEIFGYFRNPDKETVLTPWRVVNMHMSDTIGGYCFFDETFDEQGGQLDTPRFVDQGEVTQQLFNTVNPDGEATAKVLEINSKTGLYPLYVTYSLYRRSLEEYVKAQCISIENVSVQEEHVVWDDVVKDNMYVICNTPMAVGITRRTLFGFRPIEGKANIKADSIIQRAIEDKEKLADDINSIGYWKGNRSKEPMNFSAVVGNPPYQLKKEDTSDSATYHLFMDLAFKLAKVVSLITPARFLFDAGKTPHEFNVRMLNDEHLKVVLYEPKSQRIFDNVDIKGGIAITLHNMNENYGKIIRFTSYPELSSILNKVYLRDDFQSIDSQIYLQNKFDLEALYADFPQYKNIIGSNGREKRLTTSIFSQLDVFTVGKAHEDDVQIIGLIDNNRTWRFISSKYIADHPNLMKYKVILPKSNGSGALGEVLSTPLIGEPLIGYTQSFIGIGAFNTMSEANAALKYVKSKFMRTMLGILKVTQDNNTEVWKYVPIQDFTSNSDIDWNRDVPSIDKQLYDKYQLSASERDFIEKMVTPFD